MALVEAVKRLAIKNYLRRARVVIPSYDTHYENPVITEGCTLIEVISVNRLRNYKVSAAETTKIPTAQMSNNETGTCVISEELWD